MNQCPAYCDTAAATLLVSVPQHWFGSSTTALVNGCNGYQVESINGSPLGNDSTFTFNDIAGDKSWTVTCMTLNGETNLYTLQFTYFPIVALEGNFGYNYTNGTMTLAEPGEVASEMMLAQVKWRGNTTNTPEKHKRNYSIKFVYANGEKQNRKLLGMRRDNHWILDAGQADMARVRNRIATELWLDMARPPHYIDQAPDALTGVRGHMVEVFLGNDYRGIYALTEAMDRKQLQLVKHDTINNVFHGGLWKTNEFNMHSGFRIAEEFNDSLPDYYGFEVQYPDIDEVFPTSYQVLYDAIHAMAWSGTIGTFNVESIITSTSQQLSTIPSSISLSAPTTTRHETSTGFATTGSRTHGYLSQCGTSMPRWGKPGRPSTGDRRSRPTTTSSCPTTGSSR